MFTSTSWEILQTSTDEDSSTGLRRIGQVKRARVEHSWKFQELTPRTRSGGEEEEPQYFQGPHI